jgi:uncharacterized protein YjbJ (UPF0337 family)
MNKDRVVGMMDEVAGSAKRKTGELIDSPRLQVEGMVQHANGKVESAWGKAKEAVSDILQDARLHKDTRVDVEADDSTEDAKLCKRK